MSGSDLFTGTLELLVLQVLDEESMHAYGVGRRLRERSTGVLDVAEGVLYPALHRLEARGLASASWAPSESGRRARYYRLTAEGRARLAEQRAGWDTFVSAVGRILGPAGSGAGR